MAARKATSEEPAAVAKHLSELILRFPSAAAGGLRWETLVSKYNERHSTSLDIVALGHSSALSAATALLWDTLRLVDSRNKDNPVIAVEDSAAMTAQHDASATWPSLYKSLCEIASEYGSTEEDASSGELSHAILVSQLKPLLQRHWHSGFDEMSLSYFTDEGKSVRVKKMKHLLQALMQWREQRIACLTHTELDEAIKSKLEVVPSKTHNDLLLRCVSPSSPSPVSEWSPTDCQSVASQSTSASTRDCTDHLMDEIAILRAENASLRGQNWSLVRKAQEEVAQKVSMCIPVRPRSPELANQWDDPSEPPPFEYCGSAATPSASTAAPSSFFNSGDVTPCATGGHSVSSTPAMTTWVWDGQNGRICSMVPMFYVLGDRGLHEIPNGIVQQTVSQWETKESNKTIPSLFSMGPRTDS